jgi:PilZ domain
MFRAASIVEQRRHPRAQLHLPVRLRWLGPLGSLLEVTQTLDTSRGGLLVYRADSCMVDTRVWVTFPFDPEATEAQPEIAARVVRVKNTPSGGHLVALHLETWRSRDGRLVPLERRKSPRVPLSLPVRVRLADVIWPEETMTLEVSEGGLTVESARLCQPGDSIRVQLPNGQWTRAGESAAIIVHVEIRPGAAAQRVGIAWERNYKAKSPTKPASPRVAFRSAFS